jgi:hypothetical protein
MTDRKNTEDVGSETPADRIAREQRMAGTSSGPQKARDEPRAPKQTSNRADRAHEREPTVRKGYEAAQNPEPQGDGDPGPDPVSES